MTEQTEIKEQPIQEEQNNNWLKDELAKMKEQAPTADYPEALEFPEGKITTFTVDFSKEFVKWQGDDVVKKIIPVTDVSGTPKVIWLNVRNPLYKQILEAGEKGQKLFKVLRTGEKKATRYAIIKD